MVLFAYDFGVERMANRKPALSRFGDAVRNARTGKQISLRRVARLVAISPTYLSKIERGEQPAPADEKIVKLAEQLGCEPDELFLLAGRLPVDVQNAILAHPREMSALVRGAADLPPVAIEKLTREAVQLISRSRTLRRSGS
jgi:HTH-type transcriptional regulator, competence development regulator